MHCPDRFQSFPGWQRAGHGILVLLLLLGTALLASPLTRGESYPAPSLPSLPSDSPLTPEETTRANSAGQGLSATASSRAVTGATAGRPNFLFIISDDQCFESIGHRNGDGLETPHLDRLAEQGLVFTHAYNMGSWSPAVCMPSRAMLNTGRFLWDSRAVDDRLASERDAGRLWSEQLRRAGYRTYMAGKWHVRLRADSLFDVTGTVQPGMPNVFPNGHPHAYNRPRSGMPDTWDPANRAEGGFWEGGQHWSERLADEAIGFLEEAADRQEPFFMYLAFNAPHDPRQAPREYLDRYPVEQRRVPSNFLPAYPYKDAIGCPHELRDEFLAPMPRTEAAVRVHRSEYYAIVTHMDTQIGRVLEALTRSGRARNTWIFFTSDHGLAVGQHGLLGKQNLYDHSVRVPFLVVGPGVPAGRRIPEPIYYQDVMPTTLELAGIDPPEHVAFQSLLPSMRGSSSSRYRSIYTAYLDLQRAVTQDGWKLILYPGVPRARLYHLESDPRETRDLSQDAAHEERMRGLFAELRRWQIETNDPLDLTAAFSDAWNRPYPGR
jgi:arylsulfatase A-like enzyme